MNAWTRKLRSTLAVRWLALAGSLIAGIVSIALWVHFTGPHVDTVFEFNRLYEATDFGDFLGLVAQDNQPPLAGSLFWCLYHLVGGDLQALRILTGMVALLGLSTTAAFFLKWWSAQWQGSRSGSWLWQVTLFVLLVAASPGIGATMVMVRYSTVLMVLWLVAAALLFRCLRAPSRAASLGLGLVTGLSLFTSFSAVALVLFVGIASLRWRPRCVPWILLGGVPGILAVITWVLWAGSQFAARVAAKPVDDARRALATVWELVCWPIVGPASQPGALSLVLLLTGLSLVVVTWAKSSPEARWLATLTFVGAAIALLVYTAVGLNNGSMSGPTVAYLLAAAVATGAPSTSGARWAMAALATVFLTATLMTWNRVSVLRPMHFSSASEEVRDWINDQKWDRTQTLFLDGSEFGVVLHPALTEVGPTIIEYDDVRPSLAGIQEVVVVRGDDRFAEDRNRTWTLTRQRLTASGFTLVENYQFGTYSDVEIRRVLGMYNMQDSQYEVLVFQRRG